jgi:hypothetical protein
MENAQNAVENWNCGLTMGKSTETFINANLAELNIFRR